MKKIINLAFIALVIMLLTMNVNADELWNAYSTIEKSEDSRELYNIMPTSVKRGDIISVKIVAKNVKGWTLIDGVSKISWDKEAFDIVEENGKYYKIINKNIESASIFFNTSNNANIYFNWNKTVPSEKDVELIELKFKIKTSARDGIYQITQMPNDYGLDFEVGDKIENQSSYQRTLLYQVGKSIIPSNYTKDKIGDNTYIIGDNMFTRDGSDEYDGILTTEYIMLASKSIESNNKDDMIIYAKNARGKWINAITNKEINPPSEFKISYVNQKAVYRENGMYADNNYETILRLVQINDKEAIVTIENNKIHMHGIASINNRVATLSAGGKIYKIKISDNEANIETADSYMTSKKLQKKSNMTLDDYLNGHFNHASDNFNSSVFMNSTWTGRYVYGQYELYLLKLGNEYARICLREIGNSACIFDSDIYSNEDGGYFGGEETTYAFGTDELDYGVDINNEIINMTCHGNCAGNPYAGKYTKKSTLTMEDIFHVWEKNEYKYRVELDSDDGYGSSIVFIEPGKSIMDDENWYVVDNHYKSGHIFIEWQLNGKAFDVEKPITAPIKLIAKYEKMPSKPTLSINSSNSENDNYNYYLKVESPDKFDGFIIYDISSNEIGNGTPTNNGTSYSGTILRTVKVNTSSTYYAITYKTINGTRYESDRSNEIVLNPRVEKCYLDAGNNIYMWTDSPVDVWIPVPERTDSTTCLAQENTNPPDPVVVNKCYYDNSNGNAYWTANPEASWVLVEAIQDETYCVQISSTTIGIAKYTGTQSPTNLVYNIAEDAFEVLLSLDTSVYDTNNYSVSGYELFMKNGDEDTFVLDNQNFVNNKFYVSEGTAKTYFAKVYKMYNDTRVFSPKTDDITIDLTNPTYTFETIEVPNFDDYVEIKAYINDFGIVFDLLDENSHVIPSDGIGVPGYTINKTILANKNTVTLRLANNKDVVATRKNS